jgi:nuclear transport factor 2 (NTF2) superfamily protein
LTACRPDAVDGRTLADPQLNGLPTVRASVTNLLLHLTDTEIDPRSGHQRADELRTAPCEWSPPMDPIERPPLPPFAAETAQQKARLAEDAWNSRDPARVARAYTSDSEWRNRAEFVSGRTEIEAFLKRKWSRELDYRLIKEVWTFAENRIAVRFVYEWHDDSGQWFRSYGNENWEFDANGLMRRRLASINDAPIAEADRKLRWALGRRPDDHLGLSELGL